MADTTLTATDIVSDFGEYYLNGGQGEQDILMRPYEAFGTKEAFTTIPTDDTILRLSDTEVGELLQPYQDAFTPKGSVEFKPIEVALTQVKIDNEFNPSFLQNTWLGFLTSNKVDRSEWPFIRWFIDKYLLGQADEDIEMKAIFNGIKAAIVPGTAGTAIGAMNGLKKQINAGITAGDITAIATGAFSLNPKDFVTQIEEFVAEIPEKYWEKGMKLNMSRKLARRYRTGRREKYNLYYAQMDDLSVVEDSAITVAGRASHSGSEKIWMTPQANYVLGVKGFSNKGAFEIEHVKRKVAVYTDWWMGIGYLQADLVFTNDQDLV
jgi:hypothetical protein